VRENLLKRLLILVPLLLALAIVAWRAIAPETGAWDPAVDRDVSVHREDAVQTPPSLVGQPPPPEPESVRAFPDLEPDEVPAGAGVIEPGDRDVCGRLVGPDGAAVVGGVVAAMDPTSGHLLASVGTNRSGRFWLRLPEPLDEVRIRATPPRDSGAILPRDFEGLATGELDVELELLAGVWVAGRVVDEAGRGAGAIVRRSGGGLGELPGEWVRTDEEGGFRIAVPPGACSLVADSRTRGLSDSPVVEVWAPATGVRLVCPSHVGVR
jgi:hypothetical protein